MNYSSNVCMKCNCREHDNYISKNKKFIIHRCDCGHTWRTKNPEYKEEKKKAYIVGHSWGICDDDITVGVFLNKDIAEAYIKKKNIPRDEAMKQMKMCKKCRKCNYYDNPKDNVFSLANKCSKAKISVDRHGKYCENDVNDYYEAANGTDHWWCSEVDLMN